MCLFSTWPLIRGNLLFRHLLNRPLCSRFFSSSQPTRHPPAASIVLLLRIQLFSKNPFFSHHPQQSERTDFGGDYIKCNKIPTNHSLRHVNFLLSTLCHSTQSVARPYITYAISQLLLLLSLPLDRALVCRSSRPNRL